MSEDADKVVLCLELGLLAARIGSYINGSNERVTRPLGLTALQTQILWVLRWCDEPVVRQDLRKQLYVTRQALHHASRGLLERGYIEHADPQNRSFVISNGGWDVAAQMLRALYADLRGVPAPLSLLRETIRGQRIFFTYFQPEGEIEPFFDLLRETGAVDIREIGEDSESA